MKITRTIALALCILATTSFVQAAIATLSVISEVPYALHYHDSRQEAPILATIEPDHKINQVYSFTVDPRREIAVIVNDRIIYAHTANAMEGGGSYTMTIAENRDGYNINVVPSTHANIMPILHRHLPERSGQHVDLQEAPRSPRRAAANARATSPRRGAGRTCGASPQVKK